jgi:hypothetical protein
MVFSFRVAVKFRAPQALFLAFYLIGLGHQMEKTNSTNLGRFLHGFVRRESHPIVKNTLSISRDVARALLRRNHRCAMATRGCVSFSSPRAFTAYIGTIK